jgi:hypothetical protein
MVEFHARQPDLCGRGLNMFKGLHEAEIHVEMGLGQRFDASNLCRCAKLDADADGLTTATPPVKSGPADVTLHIGPVLVDVTKDKTISTIGYVPPPIRQPAKIAVVINDCLRALSSFVDLPGE